MYYDQQITAHAAKSFNHGKKEMAGIYQAI